MVSAFEWTEERTKAALALAEGYTQQDTAKDIGVTDRTIRNWLADETFAAEVDRLSLMIATASRAERLRITNRVVRARIKDGIPETEKDLLEWLKFAQSETDGIKLDLTKLAAVAEDGPSVADSGSNRSSDASSSGESVH
jgi:predicted transcriptional regulator